MEGHVILDLVGEDQRLGFGADHLIPRDEAIADIVRRIRHLDGTVLPEIIRGLLQGGRREFIVDRDQLGFRDLLHLVGVAGVLLVLHHLILLAVEVKIKAGVQVIIAARDDLVAGGHLPGEIHLAVEEAAGDERRCLGEDGVAVLAVDRAAADGQGGNGRAHRHDGGVAHAEAGVLHRAAEERQGVVYGVLAVIQEQRVGRGRGDLAVGRGAAVLDGQRGAHQHGVVLPAVVVNGKGIAV